MTAALTPELALQYLSELSTDIREAVVLDGRGHAVAGHPALASPAADLLAAADGEAIEVCTDRGAVYAVRSEHRAIAVATGRFALASLMFYDLRHVLGKLEGVTSPTQISPLEDPT